MGITLVEMMVVVAVVAVLAALAAPNLSDLYINNRLSATSNELIAVLNTARSEAMRRGTVVTVCASAKPASGCNPFPPQNQPADWSAGWIAFAEDSSRNRILGNSEEVLRIGQALNAPLTLYQASVADVGSFAVSGSVAFCPDGRLGAGHAFVACSQPATSTDWSAVFLLCHGDKPAVGNRSRSRAILVDRSGQVRLAAQNASGEPLNSTETALKNCKAPKYEN